MINSQHRDRRAQLSVLREPGRLRHPRRRALHPQRLLTQLDTAVAAFLDRMATTARGRKVVLAAYSEFGRRVAANASHGTYHGTSSPVLIAGQPVTGCCFYGDQPSLTDLDDGDLKTTTDFRDTYATLLAEALNTDPTPILGPGRTVATYL